MRMVFLADCLARPHDIRLVLCAVSHSRDKVSRKRNQESVHIVSVNIANTGQEVGNTSRLGTSSLMESAEEGTSSSGRSGKSCGMLTSRSDSQAKSNCLGPSVSQSSERVCPLAMPHSCFSLIIDSIRLKLRLSQNAFWSFQVWNI